MGAALALDPAVLYSSLRVSILPRRGCDVGEGTGRGAPNADRPFFSKNPHVVRKADASPGTLGKALFPHGVGLQYCFYYCL